MEVTLPETLPPLPAKFVGACSRLPLRNDLPAGFTAAVQGFEEWCQLLLLDAVQRFGFFQTANEVWNSRGLDVWASSHRKTNLALTQQKEPYLYLMCLVSWDVYGGARTPEIQPTALYFRQQHVRPSLSTLKCYGT